MRKIKRQIWMLRQFYNICLKRDSWIRKGCPNPPPHLIKLYTIKSYLKEYHLDIFIETGTHLGTTLDYIASFGTSCMSIELDPTLYGKAQQRFKNYKNVYLFHGDSAFILPFILEKLQKPALFWLDAHYSGEGTAGKESPISIELESILKHHIKNHVILIDDVHMFMGVGGYPHLDELLHRIRKDGNYSYSISTNIIRLVPPKPFPLRST